MATRTHNGVDRTLAILTQYNPSDTQAWLDLRHDVKANPNPNHKGNKSIQIRLSTLLSMRRIAFDTIESLGISHQFRYIFVIIDTFTKCVELFPTKNATAEAETDVLKSIRANKM